MPKPDPNDISKFKKPQRVGVLTEQAVQRPEPIKAAPKTTKPKVQTPKPVKADKPRRTEKVTVYFTEAEKRQLDADAGMVPLTKYLIAEMKKAGILSPD
ncbi:MAG: hypothetical protein AAGB04_21575 [Pseudomonadota bacterium]